MANRKKREKERGRRPSGIKEKRKDRTAVPRIDEHIRHAREGILNWLLVFKEIADPALHVRVNATVCAAGGRISVGFAGSRMVIVQLPRTRVPQQVLGDLNDRLALAIPEGVHHEDPSEAQAVELWNVLSDDLWAVRSMDPDALARLWCAQRQADGREVRKLRKMIESQKPCLVQPGKVHY